MKTSVVVLFVLAAAPAAANPTLETVLARHFEAQGGLDRLRAVKSIQVKLSDTWDGKSTTTVATRARPNLMRYEAKGADGVMVKAFDGERGWFSKAGKAELVPADMLAGMKAKAEFDDPLVDAAKRGHKVELAGVDGDAYVVRLTLASGDTQTRYIDTRTHLEVKRVLSFQWEGKQHQKTITYSDFKATNGLVTARAMTIESDGKKGRSVVDEVRYDVPAAVAMFAPPSDVAPATVKAASAK